MKLLKPGDPCPCCGRPIKEGLPTGTMIFLSWLAEGMALCEATKTWEDTCQDEAVQNEPLTLEQLREMGGQPVYMPETNCWALVTQNVFCPTPHTISVGMVNNEVGTVQDVKYWGEFAHSRNELLHTDATQAVGHIPVDVKELGADLLSMSAHKFGGPKGVGALFVRRGVDIPPMLHGGHQEAGKRAGTENVIGVAGMGAAIEWATNLLDKSVPYLTKLRDQLIDGILDIPGAELTGHPTQRSPSIASFVFSGIDGQPLVLALDERGVCASSGSACSEGEASISHVLKAMGYTEETGRGSLRLSIGWDTTEADVRYIIRAVKESVEELRK